MFKRDVVRFITLYCFIVYGLWLSYCRARGITRAVKAYELVSLVSVWTDMVLTRGPRELLSSQIDHWRYLILFDCILHKLEKEIISDISSKNLWTYVDAKMPVGFQECAEGHLVIIGPQPDWYDITWNIAIWYWPSTFWNSLMTVISLHQKRPTRKKNAWELPWLLLKDRRWLWDQVWEPIWWPCW